MLETLIAQLPASLVESVKAILTKLSMDSSKPLLPFIPKPIKAALLLLFILHSPSWPFQWHIRVWYWGIKAYYLAYKKGRSKYLKDWKGQSDKAGGIRDLRTRINRIAWVDDCDYNLHLSNSAYAKNSDALKMKWCIEALSPLFTPGAHMALGATHYNFFKEIPLGAEYVMEARCGGWDEKWFYVVIDFILYPQQASKAKSKGEKAKIATQATVTSASEKASETITESTSTLVPSISDPPTRSTSPAPQSSSNGTSTPQIATSKVEEIKRSWAVKRGRRSDGGVVCCTTISEYCFKMGRVTIPPRIGLFMSLQSPSKTDQDRARKIVMSKDGGRAFLRGGWKEEADAATLGASIGLAEDEEEGSSWVVKGRQGMESVVEGMSAF
ncbi:uncharacterized protein I303_106663 [Kwoniella dejecticola CBS 10117]|uniref:Thioesterase n=1 Tax=Kwoniella dejecticola CBS 10117 TaxID=1296121 RepID=A0A1A5ZU23_9TREE|nr:uncharacterized protein I303_08694 [Kwoniella dejecticola CBS 10117]OBR81308.1 hypothetical protein I303_08694 [Kwoniella dejecticola CBS 10117]